MYQTPMMAAPLTYTYAAPASYPYQIIYPYQYVPFEFPLSDIYTTAFPSSAFSSPSISSASSDDFTFSTPQRLCTPPHHHHQHQQQQQQQRNQIQRQPTPIKTNAVVPESCIRTPIPQRPFLRARLGLVPCSPLELFGNGSTNGGGVVSPIAEERQEDVIESGWEPEHKDRTSRVRGSESEASDCHHKVVLSTAPVPARRRKRSLRDEEEEAGNERLKKRCITT